MRVALGQSKTLSDEYLQLAVQLGVSGVQLNTPEIPGEHRWERADLERLRRRCLDHGLELEAIENVPNSFYERAMLGLPGRDEELENMCATIRNVGAAGIGLLGYNFMPGSVWRTDLAAVGRGGATVSVFDLDIATDPRQADQVLIARRDEKEGSKDSWHRGAHIVTGIEVSAEEMWANYEYFCAAVMPVAEEAGVRLALHPDDPPVDSLGGVARIFASVAALRRAAELADSDAWALQLCLGTVSEMDGEEAVVEAIESFGPSGRIGYVHFRDVCGTVPSFRECFLGEGNFDPVWVMQALRRNGFDGFMIDDHTPALVGDSPYGHRGRAHAIGYMQGILATLESEVVDVR